MLKDRAEARHRPVRVKELKCRDDGGDAERTSHPDHAVTFAKDLLMIATLIIAVTLLPEAALQKNTPPVEPLKLVGCVSTKADRGNFTFTDAAEGNQRYRLTGKDIGKYAGKRVEVTEEAAPKKFQIKGGLYPSPNVAGQAGALDPVQAGIATQRGSGETSGTTADLPEFRAARVRAVTGACQ